MKKRRKALCNVDIIQEPITPPSKPLSPRWAEADLSRNYLLTLLSHLQCWLSGAIPPGNLPTVPADSIITGEQPLCPSVPVVQSSHLTPSNHLRLCLTSSIILILLPTFSPNPSLPPSLTPSLPTLHSHPTLHTLTPSFTPSLPTLHTLTPSLTPSLPTLHTLTPSLTPSLPTLHTLTPNPSHPHSLPHTLTPNPSHPHSLTPNPSHPHSLPHTLTPSLTPSLPTLHTLTPNPSHPHSQPFTPSLFTLNPSLPSS